MATEQRLHEFFNWTDEEADTQAYPLDYWLSALDAGFGDLERDDLERVREMIARQARAYEAWLVREYDDYGVAYGYNSGRRLFRAQWSPDFTNDAV